jgi:hypothetical protein
MPDYYVGIDPGPSTGIAVLNFNDLEPPGWEVFQVGGVSAIWLLDHILRDYRPKIVAVEEFIVSNRPGTKGADAELTRRIANQAAAKRLNGYTVRERRAIDVKPWATDKRLAKTDFPWGAKFKDARDAGRHALYAAVRDGRERDPLL